MTRWSLKNGIQSYGVFYGVYTLVMLLILLIFAINVGSGDEGTIGGGNAGLLFLFINGIIIFAMHLRVGAANGVSRRTIFFNLIICTAALSLIAAVGEMLLTFISGVLIGVNMSSIMMFFAPTSNIFMQWLSYFLFMLCLGLATTAIGIFVGGAYYRMNKITKILVSVLVPVSLFVGIPALAIILPAEISAGIANSILLPVINFLSASVWNCMAGSLILAAVMMFFNWLFIRRAPVKAEK